MLTTDELLASSSGRTAMATPTPTPARHLGRPARPGTGHRHELRHEPHIGEVTVAQIKAAFELGRRLLVAAPAERPVVRSPADAANMLMAEMSLLDQEELRIMLLDTRSRILAIETLYVGNLNSASVRVGEVFKGAIRRNAAAISLSITTHPMIRRPARTTSR